MKEIEPRLIVAVVLLDQARHLLWLSVSLLAAALLAASLTGRALFLCSALLGLPALWFGLRASLDAALLRALSEGRLSDLGALDAGLRAHGLLRSGYEGRSLGARLTGALRLLMLAATAAALQALGLAIGCL